ncbi:MAG TPA: glycosyltransferase family 4 protein [Sphingopyxis sp.]|nr:glycosyltransferase family 4 protein [Sphingopyxis sp.]HMP44152.1 glycosyltransferase family 4 protein [Sphingopyxis sp.]HMQ19304.1 glycosyltransferase family 4 protein [Sphingopyxis sp.]
MNIAFLTPGAFGLANGNGGIGLYNRDIVEAIVEAFPDARVTLLQRLLDKGQHDLPERTRIVAGAAGGKARFALAILREMLVSRYDVIVCAHINFLSFARLLARRNKCPLVLIVYGIDVWDPMPGQVANLKACDAIWSISQITTDRMNAWAALPESDYVQLPNAIRLDRYAMGPKPADLVEDWNLAGKRIVMTLARLPGRDRHKGVDEMLEILPELLRRHPDLHYVVAGDGPDRARLEAKAIELGVGDHASFVGFVPEGRKADYFRLADVFAMPGRGEGFGFVFLEAAACGIPCVGSKVDGSREALRDGLLGALVDPGDPDEIVEAVSGALAKERQIPEGLDYFSWPHFVKRLEAAINAVRDPRVT